MNRRNFFASLIGAFAAIFTLWKTPRLPAYGAFSHLDHLKDGVWTPINANRRTYLISGINAEGNQVQEILAFDDFESEVISKNQWQLIDPEVKLST